MTPMIRRPARRAGSLRAWGAALFIALLTFSVYPPKSNAQDLVTVAYCADCYPFQFQDNAGAPSGLFIDQWRLWSQKSGVSVAFVEGSWEESLRLVRDGSADAHAGLTYNSERDGYLDFGAYLGRSDTRAFLHESLPPITGLDELSAYRIGFIAGDPVKEFLERRFPTANIIPYRDYETIIEELENGRLKVFAADTLTGIHFLGARGMAAQFSYPESNLLFQSEWFLAVAEGDTALLAQINEGMAQITPEENRAISDKWLGNRDQSSEGTLRIAIDWNYPPFALLNTNGEPDGLLVDFWNLWSQKTGRPIEFLSSRRKDALAAIRDGAADIHAGLVSVAEHGQWLDLSSPIIDVQSSLFFLPADEPVTGIGSFGGRKIGVVDASYHDTFLVERHPDIEIARFESVDQILSNLLVGAVDAYLGEEPTVRSIAARLGVQTTLDQLPEPIITRQLHAGLLNGRVALRQLVNEGISAISADELSEIAARWIAGYSARRASAAAQVNLTEDERAWIAENPRIRVHNETDWPPFNFAVDGVPQGYSIDYMNLLGERTGLQIEYVTGPSWSEFLGMMRDGSLDVMLNIVKTAERQKYLLYTPPYADNPNTILSRRDDPYDNLEQLFGKTVSVPRGFFYEEILKRDFPQIDLYLATDTLDSMKAVAFGQADAALGELAVFNHLLEEHLMTGLVVSGEVKMGDPELSLLNIATRQDLPVLASILTKAVGSVTLEERRAIQQKWIGAERLSDSSRVIVPLTDSERAWLAANPTIRLGTDPSFPPFEFTDEDGLYSGIASDYVRLINERLGIELVPVEGKTWGEVMTGVRDGSIDVLPAASRTPAREAFLNFTQPYSDLPVVILTREDYPFVAGLSDLVGKSVALVKDFAVTERVTALGLDIDPAILPTPRDALETVSTGQTDAAVMNLAVATNLMRQHRLTNLKVAAPSGIELPGLSFAVRKDWPELVSILDKTLASITPEEEGAINTKWIAVRYDVAADTEALIRVALQVGGVAAVIVLIIMIWNRRLQRATTEARTAQMALEESEALIKAFLDNANAMMFVKSDDRRYLLVNKAFAEFRGYAPDYMAGKTASELYEPEYAAEYDASDQQVIKSGASIVRETQATGVGGDTRDFVVNKFPVTGPDGRFIALGAVLNDITEHKQTERALQEAKEAAEKVAESKSDFLAVVSHEVRTPMNGVLGMARLLADTKLDRKQSEFADTIVHSSESLLGILNDLLDISKLEAGKLDIEHIPFDPERAVSDSVSVMSARAKEKGLSLDFDVAPDLPDAVVGDPHRLRQVLLNLISNGIKFTDSGGVSVKLDAEAGSGGLATLVLSVTDTGIGIPPATQEKLFSSYTQGSVEVARKYGGTGLGLAICRRLAELMGGDLTLDSTVGEGSCFTLHIPMRVASADELRATEATHARDAADVPETAPMRVLFVEDNLVNQRVGAAMLDKAGHRMDLAENGKQAVEMFAASTYDIVLMDRHMPVMDGIDATLKIRALSDHGASVPIIGVTAAANKSEIAECLDAGMDDVIIKPIDPDELALAMAQVGQDGSTALQEPAPAKDATPAPVTQEMPEPTAPDGDTVLDPQRIATLRKDYGEELAANLIDDFRKVAADTVPRIEAAAADGAWADLKREAHSLKGGSMTLGLSALSAHCRAIELACIDEDWETAVDGVKGLPAMFDQAMAALDGISPALA